MCRWLERPVLDKFGRSSHLLFLEGVAASVVPIAELPSLLACLGLGDGQLAVPHLMEDFKELTLTSLRHGRRRERGRSLAVLDKVWEWVHLRVIRRLWSFGMLSYKSSNINWLRVCIEDNFIWDLLICDDPGPPPPAHNRGRRKKISNSKRSKRSLSFYLDPL